MRRATNPRRLHMGCGEGLTGRLRVQRVRKTAVSGCCGARPARLKTDKDRQ